MVPKYRSCGSFGISGSSPALRKMDVELENLVTSYVQCPILALLSKRIQIISGNLNFVNLGHGIPTIVYKRTMFLVPHTTWFCNFSWRWGLVLTRSDRKHTSIRMFQSSNNNHLFRSKTIYFLPRKIS